MIDDVLATLLTHGREVGPTIDSVEEEATTMKHVLMSIKSVHKGEASKREHFFQVHSPSNRIRIVMGNGDNSYLKRSATSLLLFLLVSVL